MDKLIEYCKARYDEELGFKFGLANIFSWLFFVVCVRIGVDGTGLNIVNGLANVKLKAIIDMSDGAIPSLTMLQVLYSIAFVVLVIWISRKLSEGLFYMFTLKSDFQLLIIEMTIIFHEHKNDDLRKRALGLGAKVEIERNQKRIRRVRSLAELFLIISLATVLILPFSWINTGVVLVGVIVFIVITWSSFHFFIESLLPYFVAVKYSAGELTDIRTSFSDTLQK
ncbi:hypothetical protein PS645_01385 [Pseudomonas fluorescens]|uniref:Uncharacterized protein n=1 Tax=Pseudomonas fluorescens TaxID=294 RepID=A0A5E6R6J8_PSEFL|nr:hypothetical protein [Pseudomonas fluorescens]VVM63392.1 hypothetical protein PS645_01385 [Pseudomonas fluorescens]